MKIQRIVDIIRYKNEPYYQVEYADGSISEDFLGFRFFIHRDSSDIVQIHNDMLRVLLDNRPSEPKSAITEPIFSQPYTVHSITEMINIEGMPHLFVNKVAWVPIYEFFEVDDEYAYVHPTLLHWISEQPYVREKDEYEETQNNPSSEPEYRVEEEELETMSSYSTRSSEQEIHVDSDTDSESINFKESKSKR